MTQVLHIGNWYWNLVLETWVMLTSYSYEENQVPEFRYQFLLRSIWAICSATDVKWFRKTEFFDSAHSECEYKHRGSFAVCHCHVPLIRYLLMTWCYTGALWTIQSHQQLLSAHGVFHLNLAYHHIFSFYGLHSDVVQYWTNDTANLWQQLEYSVVTCM